MRSNCRTMSQRLLRRLRPRCRRLLLLLLLLLRKRSRTRSGEGTLICGAQWTPHCNLSAMLRSSNKRSRTRSAQ